MMLLIRNTMIGLLLMMGAFVLAFGAISGVAWLSESSIMPQVAMFGIGIFVLALAAAIGKSIMGG